MDYAFGAAVLVAGGLAAGHAIVYKRDPRSAVLWLLAILLLPALGPVLYALFGVNRVQRRALRMRRYRQRARTALESNEKPQGTALASLARLVGEVSRRPLLPGNTIDPLLDGVGLDAAPSLDRLRREADPNLVDAVELGDAALYRLRAARAVHPADLESERLGGVGSLDRVGRCGHFPLTDFEKLRAA